MRQDLPLVEHVIAGRDQVGPGGEEVLTDGRREAEAAGGVLAVDDDRVEGQLGAQRREAVDQRLAPGPPDHVAAEQQSHACPDASAAANAVHKCTRCSVTTASSI